MANARARDYLRRRLTHCQRKCREMVLLEATSNSVQRAWKVQQPLTTSAPENRIEASTAEDADQMESDEAPRGIPESKAEAVPEKFLQEDSGQDRVDHDVNEFSRIYQTGGARRPRCRRASTAAEGVARCVCVCGDARGSAQAPLPRADEDDDDDEELHSASFQEDAK